MDAILARETKAEMDLRDERGVTRWWLSSERRGRVARVETS